MSETTTLLVLAYLAPLALLALLLSAEVRRPRRLVVALLSLLPLFYVFHYLALERLQGWPSAQALPDNFRLLAFRVTEPDPQRGTPGEIVLWIEENEGDKPRAHRLAYDKDSHQQLDSAGRRLAEGRPQVGNRPSRSGEPGTTASTDAGNRASLSFRDEQPTPLPSKGSE